MKQFYFLLITIFYFLYSLVPKSVFAATMPDIFPTGYWATNGLVECAKTCTTQELQEALKQGGTCQAGCQSFDELIQVVLNVIAFGMTLALFVGAPILFGYGGIKILISGGNPGKIGEGKKILTGTLVGALIILLAYLIIKTFVTILGISGIGGFS